MLPLETLATTTTPSGDSISLDRRGSTTFFRHGTETIAASNALDAGIILAEQVCHPIRGAKQPRILIASRGLGELAAGAINVVIQKKGQIVIHDSDPDFALWQRTHLAELFPQISTDDQRIIATTTPLPELLASATDGWHGIAANLDILAATNPECLELFTTAKGLALCASHLREGSLLGITQVEYDKKILNRMGDAGLDPITDLLPTVAKARRCHLQKVVLAQRGVYQPRNPRRGR